MLWVINAYKQLYISHLFSYCRIDTCNKKKTNIKTLESIQFCIPLNIWLLKLNTYLVNKS